MSMGELSWKSASTDSGTAACEDGYEVVVVHDKTRNRTLATTRREVQGRHRVDLPEAAYVVCRSSGLEERETRFENKKGTILTLDIRVDTGIR